MVMLDATHTTSSIGALIIDGCLPRLQVGVKTEPRAYLLGKSDSWQIIYLARNLSQAFKFRY
jgi:hypothetical protein